MTLPVLIAGFTLGAAGSLHCIGMCGPLSLALPVHALSGPRRFFSLLSYQLGRVVTYTVIGILFGLAGRSIALAGYQQWFSITLGSFVLLMALLYYLHQTVQPKWLQRFYGWVQQWIGRLLRSARGPGGFFLMGMANGLLPCGMLYIALATTLSFSSVSQSAGFMAMFGLGTLPAMLLVSYAGRLFKPAFRVYFRKLVPVFVVLMGVLLVLRGLNLGVPFISPELPRSAGTAVVCHPQ